MIEIALYQPDIAPNAGAIIRTAACLGLKVRIIEPAGFVWPSPRLKRAAMDYMEFAAVERDASYEAFRAAAAGRRVVLMTTRGATPYLDFRFEAGDILMLGRESSGVPEHVHAQAEARLVIPMRPGLRSLNVSVAAAMAAGEALRQLTPPPSAAV